MAMNGALPRVAIHDIAIQTTANEIVLGTHGRSLYKAKLDLIQQLTDSVVIENIHPFTVNDFNYNKNLGKKFSSFYEPLQIKISIPFYLKQKGITTLQIKSDSGIVVATLKDTSEAGINFAKYNLAVDANAIDAFKNSLSTKDKNIFVKADDGNFYLTPGKYTIQFTTADGVTAKTSFTIKKKEKKEKTEEREVEGI